METINVLITDWLHSLFEELVEDIDKSDDSVCHKG